MPIASNHSGKRPGAVLAFLTSLKEGGSREISDEWPVILLHPDFEANHHGRFEAGQVICIESLIAEAGSESIKLESQVLITET